MFGGLLSVALALVSQPVGVTDHPVLRSPDFPPAKAASHFHQRSPNQLAIRLYPTPTQSNSHPRPGQIDNAACLYSASIMREANK